MGEPPSLQPPQCLQEGGGVWGKPGWGPSTNCTAGVAGKEPSYLSSKLILPPRRSPLAQAGGPCTRAVMCCVSTDCTCWLCSPTPGGHVRAALQGLPSCSNMSRVGSNIGQVAVRQETSPRGGKATGSACTPEHHKAAARASLRRMGLRWGSGTQPRLPMLERNLCSGVSTGPGP